MNKNDYENEKQYIKFNSDGEAVILKDDEWLDETEWNHMMICLTILIEQ